MKNFTVESTTHKNATYIKSDIYTNRTHAQWSKNLFYRIEGNRVYMITTTTEERDHECVECTCVNGRLKREWVALPIPKVTKYSHIVGYLDIDTHNFHFLQKMTRNGEKNRPPAIKKICFDDMTWINILTVRKIKPITMPHEYATFIKAARDAIFNQAIDDTL